MSVLARNHSRHVSSIFTDRTLLNLGPSAFLYGQRRCYASAQKQKLASDQNYTSSPSARKASAKNAKTAIPPPEDISLEKRMEMLDFLRTNGHMLPFDPFAQASANYDLHIPTYKSWRKDASIMDHIRVFFQTQRNSIMNAWHLHTLVKIDSLPGVKASPWSFKMFSLQSTKPDAWISTFRKIALDTYERVNQAVAERDINTLKKLTGDPQQEQYLKLVRAHDPSRVYVWKMHGEREPCRVVSLRAHMEHIGDEPKFGNRYIVQALVRFDTLQTLQIYSKKGALLHEQKEPKPVVEYLAFQKRMWYDSPWIIRERFYEGAEQKYITIAN